MRFLILCLFFVFGVAYAEPIKEMPERLGQFTESLDVVSASFDQIKMIPESDKKFNATGRVKFKKGDGFIWIQEKPNKQVFVSTTDKYCIDGQSNDLSSLPYFHYIRRVINDTLNGDITKLNSVFDVDYSEYGKNQWQLTAKSRLSSVSNFLQDFVMYGTTADLTKVIITYQDGTVVIIKFNRLNMEIKDEIVC